MTSPLERVERLIAGAVEGVAERWFTATGDRAVLARRLEVAMVQEVRAWPDGLLTAPDRFVIRVDAASYEYLADEHMEIEQELERHIAAAAAARALRQRPAPFVRIDADSRLWRGGVAIDAGFEDQPPIATMEPPLATLELVSGPGAPAVIPIGAGETSLGRAPDNDVVLADPAVSRHHARLHWMGEEFVIVDLGSANGTAINGHAVHESVVRGGDGLRLGKTEAIFRRRGA